MRIIHGSAAVGGDVVRPVVTIGSFDGLHVGHRAIMDTVVARARALGSEAAVYTFEPHPRKVLQPESAPLLLTTLEQTLELIADAGIDVTIVEPFTQELSLTAPERFVRDVLHARLRPREVYVGYNFRFGHHREGSMQLLREIGPGLGFAVHVVPKVTIEGRDVSSTRIRALLAGGEVEEAALLLGRAFSVRGRVVAGERRGRSLGFPTANLAPENETLPAAGVYAGHLRLLDAGAPPSGQRLPAVTNVGLRPTFAAPAALRGLEAAADRRAGSGAPATAHGLVAEAHCIDFAGDLYGRRVELSFEARLREERRFPGPEALREQIAKDLLEARRRLAAS